MIVKEPEIYRGVILGVDNVHETWVYVSLGIYAQYGKDVKRETPFAGGG